MGSTDIHGGFWTLGISQLWKGYLVGVRSHCELLTLRFSYIELLNLLNCIMTETEGKMSCCLSRLPNWRRSSSTRIQDHKKEKDRNRIFGCQIGEDWKTNQVHEVLVSTLFIEMSTLRFCCVSDRAWPKSHSVSSKEQVWGKNWVLGSGCF